MSGINHLAVIVCVVVHAAFGFLWYGVLFADPWIRAVGKTMEELEEGNTPVPYIVDAIGWLLASYLIAWLIKRTNTVSAGGGATLGALLAICIAAPAVAVPNLFAGVDSTLTMINVSGFLVAAIITGAILGGWRKKPAV